MKIFIVFELLDQPTGGGNQFLKTLKKQFALQNVLADSPDNADVFLFNSHHFLKNVASLKKSFPKAKFIHRIDGPMRLYNDLSDARDQQVYFANELFADGTVYQSEWSKNKNLEMGLEPKTLHTVIQNCADESIFFPCKQAKTTKKKIRLFSSSWSDHEKKGFAFYDFLDKNLDFEKYDYFFAGRSPITFNNIKNIGPLDSNSLANELRKSDVFVTASQNDPCSNSLIEAMTCGLKCLALNSGGHPEIVRNQNLLFENEVDFLKLLNNISNKKNTASPSLNNTAYVAEKYFNFFKTAYVNQG